VPHKRLWGAELHSNDVTGTFWHATTQKRNTDELGIRRHNGVIRDHLGCFLENGFFNFKVFGGSLNHEIDIVKTILHTLRITYPLQHAFSFSFVHLFCSNLVVNILFNYALAGLKLGAIHVNDLNVDVRQFTCRDQANS